MLRGCAPVETEWVTAPVAASMRTTVLDFVVAHEQDAPSGEMSTWRGASPDPDSVVTCWVARSTRTITSPPITAT